MSGVYTDIYYEGAGGFQVLVDWNADGDYGELGEDVTGDVRARQAPVTVAYGREAGGNAATTSASGGMVLDNSSRRYSPRNTASPLYGNLKPRRPVRIVRGIAADEAFAIFDGFTDESPINPAVTDKTVGVSLVDQLANFRGQNITTAVYQGIRTGEAIGRVLDAVGWSADRDLDPGASVLPFWWEDGDALTALDKIVRSEGFPALVSIGASGEFIFRDRFHRHVRTASSAVQSTWRNSGRVEPVMAREFSYDDAWPNIVNTATAQVDERAIGQLQEVWRFGSQIYVGLGETRTFWLTFDEPVVDAQVPVGGFDYEKVNPLLPSGGTITLTRTSGRSLGITIAVSAFAVGPINLSFLRLRARLLTIANSQVVTTSDSASIDTYGSRSFDGDLPWCNREDAQAIVNRVVADRKDPLPVVDVRFLIGQNTARAAALLSRDLSERVRIVEPETALDDDFHIERIQHAFTSEHDHEIVFTVEHVPPTTYTNLFVLDSSVLGTGVLG